MERRDLLRSASVLGTAVLLAERPGPAFAGPGTPLLRPEEIAGIEEALGKKGKRLDAERLFTVALPRNDLSITVRGEPVPIPFGFGGWVSFKRTRDGKSIMLMSDAVLLQTEVQSVIDGAIGQDLEVSALHNHFLFEEPRVCFMHLHGMSRDAAGLARRFSQAIGSSGLHPSKQPTSTGASSPHAFDLPALDRILGAPGTAGGPVAKWTFSRSDLTPLEMNVELTAALGAGSWLALVGAPEKAHAAGDLALLETEVDPVLRILRAHGLDIAGLHNHTLGEEPRLFFVHFLGHGPADRLAQALRSALDELGRHGRKRKPMDH
jgi:hypothetical protein